MEKIENVEEKLQELNRKYNGMVLKRGCFCFENKEKGIWIEKLKVVMVAFSYDGLTAVVYAENDEKKGRMERLKTAYTQYSNYRVPLEDMLEERMRSLTELERMMQESMETDWSKRFDPESLKFITPLTDENIADFIATVVVQQPSIIYISIDRDDIWKTDEGKKLLKALDEACKNQ